jgi:hypothetical protein
MRYVIEIITHDGIVCKVDEYRRARRMYNMVRNTSNAEVEIYKFADYIKLHPDFADKYNSALRGRMI